MILPFEVQNLSVEGRGISELNGKKVFIMGALENEKVQAKVMRQHSRFLEAKVETIELASLKRIEPICEFFGECGGCQLQHLSSEHQIEHKTNQLKNMLSHMEINPDEWCPAVTGPAQGYRYKARLGVRYVEKKGGILVGFRESHSNKIVEMTSCAVIHPKVGNLIQPLRDLIAALSIKKEVPQVELSAGSQEVSLVFRVLVEPLDDDKEKLIHFAKQHEISIYLQPKGVDSVYKLWPDSMPVLSYQLKNGLTYHFHPLEFTQINPFINEQMVTQALKWLNIESEDKILDLFCGLGNFSLGLAQRAKHVTGVEGDGGMVERAKENAQNNQIANIDFFEANLFEDCQAKEWFNISYDKLLLDPPRSGANYIVDNIEKIAPKMILYVSCDMNTFTRDAAILVHQKNYRLEKVSVLDMFPHTKHVETMGLFVYQK